MKIVITCFIFLFLALLAIFTLFQGGPHQYAGKLQAIVRPAIGTPDRLPSSIQVDKELLHKPIAVVSIVIDDEHLNDPERGIFANWREKGRGWEVPASLSYFNSGHLLFATEVGVRVHGGTSRRLPRRSLRLYFRSEYGTDRFLPGLLFDDSTSKLNRLIVHNDRRRKWRIINPLSYDLTRKMGGLAPRTSPVSLSLNGKDFSLYFLTERLGRQYLINKLGHQKFDFVRYTGRLDNPQDHPESYRKLSEWARDRETPMSFDDALERVDIENLSLWGLAQAYVGNSDPFQGMAVLDRSKKQPRWFWISWDMDHGFRTRGGYKDVDSHKKGTFEYVLNRRALRSVILSRLTEESEDFKKYFRDLAFKSLNHHLTKEYLLTRVSHYERILNSHEVEDLEFLEELKTFIRHRHDYLRERMKEFFEAKESYHTTVETPSGTSYTVDGYEKVGNYDGWYEAGSSIKLNISKSWRFSHWLINGEDKIKASTLSYVVNSETEIEAVFR